MIKVAESFDFTSLDISSKYIEVLMSVFKDPTLFIAIARFDIDVDVFEEDLAWYFAVEANPTFKKKLKKREINDEQIVSLGRTLLKEKMGARFDYSELRTAAINTGYIVPSFENFCLKKAKLRMLFDLDKTKSVFDDMFVYKYHGAGNPFYSRENLREHYVDYNALYESYSWSDKALDIADIFINRCLMPDEKSVIEFFLHSDFIAVCHTHEYEGMREIIFGLEGAAIADPDYWITMDEFKRLRYGQLNLKMSAKAKIMPQAFDTLKDLLSR